MEYRDNKKEELYSQAIPAGKRRYFFDVKATRAGDKFITITESRKVTESNGVNFRFEKQKMYLYKEDFEKFQHALANALSFIETGIVPPPVVVENEPQESAEIDLNGSASVDDIDTNF